MTHEEALQAKAILKLKGKEVSFQGPPWKGDVTGTLSGRAPHAHGRGHRLHSWSEPRSRMLWGTAKKNLE